MVGSRHRRFGRLFALVAWLAFAGTASAHRLDEYLQATLVAIDPEAVHLHINLTPGVAVAEQVLRVIDADGDGLVSTNEIARYAEKLKSDLSIRLDGHELKFQATSSYCPGLEELRTGWGFIQIGYTAKLRPLAAGPHGLTVLNRHLPAVSVYLVNAAQPSSKTIEITKQTRNENQSCGEIDFTLNSQATPRAATVSIMGGVTATLVLLLFIARPRSI